MECWLENWVANATMHALTILLDIYYKGWTKSAHWQVILQQSVKTQQVAECKHKKSGRRFVDDAKRTFTLASPITLIISVPLQKHPFL